MYAFFNEARSRASCPSPVSAAPGKAGIHHCQQLAFMDHLAFFEIRPLQLPHHAAGYRHRVNRGYRTRCIDVNPYIAFSHRATPTETAPPAPPRPRPPFAPAGRLCRFLFSLGSRKRSRPISPAESPHSIAQNRFRRGGAQESAESVGKCSRFPSFGRIPRCHATAEGPNGPTPFGILAIAVDCRSFALPS